MSLIHALTKSTECLDETQSFSGTGKLRVIGASRQKKHSTSSHITNVEYIFPFARYTHPPSPATTVKAKEVNTRGAVRHSDMGVGRNKMKTTTYMAYITIIQVDTTQRRPHGSKLHQKRTLQARIWQQPHYHDIRDGTKQTSLVHPILPYVLFENTCDTTVSCTWCCTNEIWVETIVSNAKIRNHHYTFPHAYSQQNELDHRKLYFAWRGQPTKTS